MQDTVDDDPVKFGFISSSELFCIGANGIQTDEQVAGNPVSLAVVECDDIGVIIVLQILEVYFQNLFVGAEDIGYFTYSLIICSGYGFYPCGDFALLDRGHFNSFGVVTNHSGMFN